METYRSTNITSSGKIKAEDGPGGVHTVTLAAGADAATLILYNNTAGSGTIICKLAAVTGTTAHARLDVPFTIGCYGTLTGTGPSATVSFW